MNDERTAKQKFVCSQEERAEILKRYGERGARAIDAVSEGRVKKYRDFFVVVGRSDEYVVEDEFCTCRDAVFRGGECSHVLAVRFARVYGGFEEIDLWYLDDLCL